MDELVQQVFVTACADVQRACLYEMYQAYRNSGLRVVTGKLRGSIGVDCTFAEIGPDAVAMTMWITAGGLDAYYGWFHEYGTGRYIDGTQAIALSGYIDPDTHEFMDFNTLRPSRDGGWDIVGREDGPMPGVFISKGVQARHWFRQGAVAALRRFRVIGGHVDLALGRLFQATMALDDIR